MESWWDYYKAHGFLPEKIEGEEHPLVIDLSSEVEDTLDTVSVEPQTEGGEVLWNTNLGHKRSSFDN